MKPKKQIDFLVEDFFNTGKLDLNKDEEGITFDQLIVESKYGHLKNKEFMLHNPKNNQDTIYTIHNIDNQNDEDAYVTVLDRTKSTRNFNLRFLVVNSPDLQDTLKRGQLKNFLPQEEKVVDPPLSPEEEITVDLHQEEPSIENIINDILHKADTLDELQDAIELTQAGGIDITDPQVEPIFWQSFKKRENEIEKALSLDQEVRSYDPTELSAGAQEVLKDSTWETMEMSDLEESIKTLDDEIDRLKEEMGKDIEDFKTGRGYKNTKKGKKNTGQQKNIEEFRNEWFSANITPILSRRESMATQLKELEEVNDPNYLFAEVFVENPCFIHALTQRRDNEEEEVTFQDLRQRILEKYGKDRETNTLNTHFKFFKTLKAGWLEKGHNEIYITHKIIKLIEVLNNPRNYQSQGELYKEKCSIEEFDELRAPGKFVYRAEQSVKNALPLQGNITIEEMTQMALYRVNAIFNIIQDDENNILKMKHAKKDKYKKLLQLIKSYGLGEKIEEWYDKYNEGDEGEKRYMVRLVEDSLREVVYGLGQMESQMKDIIENKHLADKKTIQVLNNVYNRVNDADTITDNLQAIRQNNSKIYELSFANCINGNDNNPYFIHSTNMEVNGDGSTIVANSDIISGDNNIWLRGKMDDIITGDTTVSEVRDIIYDEISPDGVVKFDIKAAQDVVVTPISGGENLTIPKGSYIEVKKSRQHSYHLSEFFGVYKNYKKDSFPQRYNKENYKIVYNQIINGVIKKINSRRYEGDRGVIDRLTDIENGTFGIFFQDYIFYKLSDLEIKWTNIGQRKTESRMTISIKPSADAVQYLWTRENGNCNCEPLLPGVRCDDNLPHLNESIDNYISEALGF